MNNIDETGMPTGAYITVKRNEKGEVGVYVGGNPVTTYRGQPIVDIPCIKKYFAELQKRNPNIEELHILASRTWGRYAVPDVPKPEFGPNMWCRVKHKKEKTYGAWLHIDIYDLEDSCASYGPAYCALYVLAYKGFCLALLKHKSGDTVIDRKSVGEFKNMQSQLRQRQDKKQHTK